MLRAAILRIGGTMRGDAVLFTNPDGRPRKEGGWTWFGVAVRGNHRKHGKVLAGVYTYTEGANLGSFVEAYDARDALVASVEFSPPDLSPDSLEVVLCAFVADHARRHGPGAAAAVLPSSRLLKGGGPSSDPHAKSGGGSSRCIARRAEQAGR